MHVTNLAVPTYKDLLGNNARSAMPTALRDLPHSIIVSKMHFRTCQQCKNAEILLPSRLWMHPRWCMRSRPVSHG